MGELYEAKLKIEKIIEDKRLDPIKTKGEIGLRVGIMLGFINTNTPDNDFKLKLLKNAVQEILGESI